MLSKTNGNLKGRLTSRAGKGRQVTRFAGATRFAGVKIRDALSRENVFEFVLPYEVANYE